MKTAFNLHLSLNRTEKKRSLCPIYDSFDFWEADESSSLSFIQM